MDLNQKVPKIDTARFAAVPRADVPRSKFEISQTHKTTFNFDYLIPILCKEVLPGDYISGKMEFVARLISPLSFPLMDYLELRTEFFFVPNRLVWTNFVKMMGERKNPADSIAYTIPVMQSTAGGWNVGSIFDYFGLPTAGGALGANVVNLNVLPLRMYNLIWNEWYRDQNLQNAVTVNVGDTEPQASTVTYTLLKRNKKHDYFTSAAPTPQKGADVIMPMAGQAPLTGIALATGMGPTAGNPPASKETSGATPTGWAGYVPSSTAASFYLRTAATAGNAPLLYADLSSATGATINQLRLAFATQALLERDMRGGTRYTELNVAHFGVQNLDLTLGRPQYIGGGRSNIQTQAIPQTSATGLTGGTSSLGALGATAQASDQHTFDVNVTEHGYIIGLVSAIGEITYQQGVEKHWWRSTRYDIYWPAFAGLGEQPIYEGEIYTQGTTADTTTVFGYKEAWAEYKYGRSMITGNFRSTAATNIDEWHVSQQFGSAPALNTAFIEYNTPMTRVLAGGAHATGQQVIFDSVFQIEATRPMPVYSIPAQLTRF